MNRYMITATVTLTVVAEDKDDARRQIEEAWNACDHFALDIDAEPELEIGDVDLLAHVCTCGVEIGGGQAWDEHIALCDGKPKGETYATS